jgi:hypothetical protein
MTNHKPWQHVLDCVQSAFKAFAHESGYMKRTWAGCQFFQFGPEREKNFLLTSPFIERISQIQITGAWAGLRPRSCMNPCNR